MKPAITNEDAELDARMVDEISGALEAFEMDTLNSMPVGPTNPGPAHALPDAYTMAMERVEGRLKARAEAVSEKIDELQRHLDEIDAVVVSIQKAVIAMRGDVDVKAKGTP